MALSNIFKEPRREITETLVGLAVVACPLALFCLAAYLIAQFLTQNVPHMPFDQALLMGVLLTIALCLFVAAVVLLSIVIPIAVHGIGEAVCAALDRRGLRLRPT